MTEKSTDTINATLFMKSYLNTIHCHISISNHGNTTGQTDESKIAKDQPTEIQNNKDSKQAEICTSSSAETCPTDTISKQKQPTDISFTNKATSTTEKGTPKPVNPYVYILFQCIHHHPQISQCHMIKETSH